MKQLLLLLATSTLALAPACDDSGKPIGSGGVGSGGTGASSADGGVPGGGVVTLTDGGIALTDAGMPTSCTIGPSGPLGLVPVETMAPGTACGLCHLAIGKPIYIAGTVYPSFHDPDLCLGVTNVQIELTDSTGAKHTMGVNSSGNFLDQSILELWPSPWKVAVVRGNARRPMVGAVMNGDCNECHTAPGAQGAPGRIVAPDDDTVDAGLN